MTKTSKQKTLLLIGCAALVMILLTLSLPTLQMRAGTGALFHPDQSNGGSADFAGLGWIIWIMRGFTALALILLPVYILINLRSPEGRRMLSMNLVAFLVVLLAALALSKLRIPQTESEPPADQNKAQTTPAGLDNAQKPPVFEEQPQPWMIALTGVGLAALFALTTFFILRYQATHHLPRSPLQDLAANAQKALDELETGADFADVVVRCYAHMSRALREAHGIQRAEAMTPHEFEQALRAKGFPPRPVQQLTLLFEQVRYGHQPTGEAEKRAAAESLKELLAFCRQ